MNVGGRVALALLVWYTGMYFTTESGEFWHTLSFWLCQVCIFVFVAFGEKKK